MSGTDQEGSGRPEAREVEAEAAGDRAEVGEPSLPGTLFLLMLFLVGVVGLWGTVYWMLLTR